MLIINTIYTCITVIQLILLSFLPCSTTLYFSNRTIKAINQFYVVTKKLDVLFPLYENIYILLIFIINFIIILNQTLTFLELYIKSHRKLNLIYHFSYAM